MKETLIILLYTCFFGTSLTITCTSPWKFSHGSSCYFYSYYPGLTWGEARLECRSYGGYLAAIDNEEELNATKENISPHHRGNWFWIGATDLGTEGVWHWDHNGKELSFEYWNPGEPSGKYRENCLMGFGLGRLGRWNDMACDNIQAFLCEKD